MSKQFKSPLLLSSTVEGIHRDLDSTIASLPSSRLRGVDAVVVRVLSTMGSNDFDSTQKPLRAAAERLRSLPLCAIGFDSKTGRLEGRVFDGDKAMVGQLPAEQIHLFQAADLLTMFSPLWEMDKARGLSYHYIAPSGRHSKHFVRLEDALRGLDAIDTVAFWLQPHIWGRKGILVDTWGLVPAVMRSLQRLGLTTPIMNMGRYPEVETETVRNELAEFVGQCPDGDLALLVSISDSGGLATRVTSMLHSVLGGATNVASVGIIATQMGAEFHARRSMDRVLCVLPDEYASVDAVDCGKCKEGSTGISIDPVLYHISARVTNESFPKKSLFKGMRGFLDLFGAEPGALRIHTQDDVFARHQAFDIDVEVLLGNESFVGNLKSLLQQLSPHPRVVVVPQHAAGRRLGQLASALLGIPFVETNDLRKASMSSASATLIKSAKHILVLDDVVTTGRALEDLNRALREDFGGSSGGLKSVAFVVGVARPETDRAWDDIVSSLTTGIVGWVSSVQYVTKVLLPDWNENYCPWCHERNGLLALVRDNEEPCPWLSTRLAELDDRSQDLQEAILLVPKSVRPKAGGGSPIVPAGTGSVGVAFSIASGLQGLRSMDEGIQPKSIPPRLLKRRTLRLYSESLFRGLFLRLARSEEWDETVRGEFWDSYVVKRKGAFEQVLLGECLLAILRGALHRPSANAFRSAFKRHLGGSTERIGKTLGIG